MSAGETQLKIGVPTETFPGETRVALVPAAIKPLAKAGFELVLQKGAGFAAGFTDEEYRDAGASIVGSRDEVFAQADVIACVRAGGANVEAGSDDLSRLKPGQVLIGHLDPLSHPAEITKLAEQKIDAYSLELLPRITRAQSMDVLSSMATIAGYKLVLLAANELPRMFPMMMTAAGTVKPARVFVMGAGVAGLQAIATAKRLGSVVYAYDVRPVVKEQVESVGGKFIELDLETEQAEGKGGYAKEMSEEFLRKQREAMKKVIAESDVVITTAAIPGRKAPILVTENMVTALKPGSVLIDLAAERGGNCELTKAGETVKINGVKIMGPVNIPALVPYHASEMYSKNVQTFLLHLQKTGLHQPDITDEIVRDTLLTREGAVVNARIREALGLEPLNPPKPEETPAVEQPVGGDQETTENHSEENSESHNKGGD
ncbi:MAG: Re/Si-specific NAD(P)(+) transhydrogenase subunit alpha [Planctomycetaceae bacterium]|jgi:H+-translocating NAD(P) transhydrogenase subunit alpha|nr:Re/Si-specific NAD(P)(+) transhydrogenase subunit alpha [Planctomycetaceae bacterium]MDG2388695.1 Re/Si-specific NAD(P)(+) transhydrogenase subunit alpha [Planctomycetaceae bacterium]